MTEHDENELDVEPDLDEEALDEDEDLDDELEDELDEPDLDDAAIDIVDLDAAADTADVKEPVAAADVADEEDEVVLDLDEELHPDDVEEPLDVLLQERTAAATLEDDEEEVEEEEVDTDDRGEGPARILPRRPGEFLCRSCFLVLPRNQLADDTRMLCRDCA